MRFWASPMCALALFTWQVALISRRPASKADQALALGRGNQESIDATNEKINRMFRRHLSK
jgi:hypothetical protein